MKKSITAMALVIGMGLVTACGGSGDEPGEAAPPPPVETETPDADPAEPAEAETAETTQAAGSSEFAALPEPYASADFDRGKRVFLQCQSCHTLTDGGAVVLGPNLYGMFGREVGTSDGFEYSAALQEADFIWTPELLDQWLARPRDFLPGNNMSFAGVQRPDDRTAVIAYVMSQTGYEAP
ncbi:MULTISPECIES: c-type cytochrome [Henriciella]|jgi:cytochrome c|uniref:c-type cytochrome n=1 Tax=Henriciella TaxID=453849 RepID=UPI003512A104